MTGKEQMLLTIIMLSLYTKGKTKRGTFFSLRSLKTCAICTETNALQFLWTSNVAYSCPAFSFTPSARRNVPIHGECCQGWGRSHSLLTPVVSMWPRVTKTTIWPPATEIGLKMVMWPKLGLSGTFLPSNQKELFVGVNGLSLGLPTVLSVYWEIGRQSPDESV